MHAAYLLRGNAYAVILRNGRGNPTALIPVNPDNVTVLRSADGSIFYSGRAVGCSRWPYCADLPLMIPEDDVFHLRGLASTCWSGLSRISIARDSFGVAMGLEQQAARFMANGARPSGVLQTDKKLSPTPPNGCGRNGSSFGPASRTPAAPRSSRRVSSGSRCSSARSISSSSRSASFRSRRRALVRHAALQARRQRRDGAHQVRRCRPGLRQHHDHAGPRCWEQKFIQKFDLDKEGPGRDFDERRLLRAAEATRINNQRLKIMSGISTQNECRAENGDPPFLAATCC
jgi:phage portal protein BeeE